MIKILQINTVSNSGSTGRIAEGIAQTIKLNNWESFIAYGRHKNPSYYSKEILVGDRWDFYTHVLGTRLTDGHGLYSKNATVNLLSQISELEPDLIHLHNIHGYYLNIKMLFDYIKKHNIPVVWTLHDCWAFTGHCSHYSHVNCNLWKTQCNHCPQTSRYPKSYIDFSKRNYNYKKELFNNIKHLTIVTPSEWLANEVKDSFLGEYSRQVINNGIDLQKFLYRENSDMWKHYKIQNQKVILGVASIWDDRKGFEDFIRLNKQISNLDFQIVMVGLSQKQLKNLPKGIIGIARTENIEQLAELYSLADIFFNPTYEDNFPTTNIEALACGTPVITYNTGGSPEIIDQNTGWVVQPGDLLAVKNILSSLNDKDSYKLYCRKRAETFYSDKVRFQDYIEIYKKYLD